MQTPPIGHEEICRLVGQLYIDAHLRISELEKQVASTNPLPLIQSLQQQITKLREENAALKERDHEAVGA